MPDTPYVPMPHLDKRIEAALNAASLIQEVAFPDCCYQMSEAIGMVLTELGIPAFAQACDVYGWNNDFLRFKNGEHLKIEKHNKNLKNPKKNNRHPQRKSNRSKPNAKKQIDPYTLAIYHEQEVEGSGYDGHVICIADGWILDATSAQFHRPHKRLTSTRFNTIPLKVFQEYPETFKQNWCEEKFMVKTSFDEGLIAITQPDKKSGQMAYCLRPDIEPDNWLEFTPTAKANIVIAKNWILDITNQILSGDVGIDIYALREKYG